MKAKRLSVHRYLSDIMWRRPDGSRCENDSHSCYGGMVCHDCALWAIERQRWLKEWLLMWATVGYEHVLGQLSFDHRPRATVLLAFDGIVATCPSCHKYVLTWHENAWRCRCGFIATHNP